MGPGRAPASAPELARRPRRPQKPGGAGPGQGSVGALSLPRGFLSPPSRPDGIPGGGRTRPRPRSWGAAPPLALPTPPIWSLLRALPARAAGAGTQGALGPRSPEQAPPAPRGRPSASGSTSDTDCSWGGGGGRGGRGRLLPQARRRK